VGGGFAGFTFLGRLFARKAGEAMCNEHGLTVIDEGYKRFTDSEGFLFQSRIERRKGRFPA
jgi:hypothetical protein